MRKKLPEKDKKKKTAFSINEELLKLIDEQAEKDGIKRSQVIEKVLTEHLKKLNTNK